MGLNVEVKTLPAMFSYGSGGSAPSGSAKIALDLLGLSPMSGTH